MTIPHKDYFDVDASYTIDDGWFDCLTIRAGVENLTDEPPPIIPFWSNANTDPSQFDVLGRRYYVTFCAALLTRHWSRIAHQVGVRHPLLTLPSVGIA